jgi:hypothetical protein
MNRAHGPPPRAGSQLIGCLKSRGRSQGECVHCELSQQRGSVQNTEIMEYLTNDPEVAKKALNQFRLTFLRKYLPPMRRAKYLALGIGSPWSLQRVSLQQGQESLDGRMARPQVPWELVSTRGSKTGARQGLRTWRPRCGKSESCSKLTGFLVFRWLALPETSTRTRLPETRPVFDATRRMAQQNIGFFRRYSKRNSARATRGKQSRKNCAHVATFGGCNRT